MKRIISLFMVLTVLIISTNVFASFSDVPNTASYNDAVDRVTTLGIMSSEANGTFKPNSIVTREQFAKIIVITAGLNDVASSLTGQTIYSDVDKKNVLNGYIKEAVTKGYLSGMADGKFHPKDAVSYAQVCTAMISVLGYTAQDIPGLWPKNYIDKVNSLSINDGVTLSSNDKVTKWQMAIMLDNLLDTNVKKVNAQEADKTLATASNLSIYNMYTVYSKPEVAMGFNPATKKLGALDLSGNPEFLRTTIDPTTTPATNTTGESISINDIKDFDVVYQVSDASKTRHYILVVDNKVSGEITGILPDKIYPKTIQISNKNYDVGKYFDVKKINNTSGAFNVGDAVTALIGYDGRVVALINSIADDASDVVYTDYSRPEVVTNYDPAVKKIGAIDLNGDPDILRNTIDATTTPPTNTTGESITVNNIKNNDIVYQVSDKRNTIRYILVVDNKISGKITGILPNKIFPKTIQIDGKSYSVDKYFDTSKVNSLKGAFNVGDSVTALLGYDGKIVTLINSIDEIDSSIDYSEYSSPVVVANYSVTDGKVGQISLRDNLSIIRNTIDIGTVPVTNKIGEQINSTLIKDNDVIYKVSDRAGKNSYILDIDNKVTGTITSILPNKVSPKTIQIDNKNYDLSKYVSLSKLNNTPGAYNVGDSIKVLLGYDGKVVDVISNTNADNADYALVLNNYSNTSTAIADNGSTIYYVKLLHTDGSIKTYIINDSGMGYTGELVKFKITADANSAGLQTVALEKMVSVDPKEYNIDRDNRKLGSSYIADDVKIFNLVFKTYGADCDARLMNWSDMPNGTVPAGKIKYYATVGAFNDINIMLVDNILDENYSYGVLTKSIQKISPQTGTTYTNTILIDGKEYTTSSNIPGLSINSVVKVVLRNGSVLSIEQVVSQWVDSVTVDAIDTKRVMVNGTIYDIASDVAIYTRDYNGTYIVKGTNDIVPGQKYSRVFVFLDKAPSNGGKVKVIIFS